MRGFFLQLDSIRADIGIIFHLALKLIYIAEYVSSKLTGNLTFCEVFLRRKKCQDSGKQGGTCPPELNVLIKGNRHVLNYLLTIILQQ